MSGRGDSGIAWQRWNVGGCSLPDLATKLSELRVLELRADVAYLKGQLSEKTRYPEFALPYETRSQIGSRIRGKLALIHRLAEES